MVFLNFDINSKLNVCHKCDIPKCFNPDHLFIGTHADNVKDKVLKGRAGFKLNKDDILIIRERIQNGECKAKIAREFKVTRSAIQKIYNKTAWAWLF